MKRYIKLGTAQTLVVVLLLTVVACGKYYDPPMVFEEPPSGERSKDRKVLLISIDGLPGAVLQESVPTHIASLLDNAKYSFDGFSDGDTGDAATWTTMMAGTSSGRHGVRGNSFELDIDDPDSDEEDTHDAGGEIQFTTMLQRILETGRRLRTLSVTTDPATDEYLFPYSDHRVVVESDLAVKDSTVKALEQTDALAVAVVNFRELLDIGKAGGFSRENGAYTAALNTIDGYVGDILTALRERSTAGQEDWLIIVTSNHGADGDSYGGPSRAERNIPIIMHNPNFVGKKLEMPPITNAFRAGNNGIFGSISGADAAMYNVGTSGEYTIQLKLFMHEFGTNNGAIISKQNNTGNPDAGWSFIHNGNIGWRFKIGGNQVTADQKFDLEKWYTLTARIYMDGSTRKVQVFTDGELLGEGDITANGTSNNNLNVGWSASWSGGTWRQAVRDLVIYNTALPVEYIQENYCNSPVDDTYSTHAIGNWGMDEGFRGTMYNKVDGAPNFTLNGTYAWEFLLDDFCKTAIPEDNSNQLLINAVDLAPQIYYWMNIEPHTSWGLEGSVFLNLYEREFIEQ